MNHDPSNPFQKLAKNFAVRKVDAADARTARQGSAFPPPPGKKGGDDDALFLDAVSRIRPLAKKADKKAGRGESLAERMRANDTPGRSGASNAAGGPVSMEPAGPGRAATAGDAVVTRRTESETEQSESGGAPFDVAMRDLFEGPAGGASREGDVLFAKAMQGVAPVNGRGRDVTVPAGQGRPVPAQDPAKALRDVLEGRVEFALHHTDEFMEGYVVGVDPLVLSRLRAGQYSPEKHMDMHGMNARQAYDALTWFMRDAYQRGFRCVVVVTGRGRNSPDGVGVLRPLLQRWLSREPFKRVVLAFCTARPGDGGPGAVYVLLRKYKKSRGKIIWDHTPSDDDFPDI